ncbi:MAG: DUF4386 family protein [Dehalococcoidia bacterium]
MSMIKLGGIAGIVFAVLLVAAAITTGEPPGGTDSDAEIVAWYEDSGNQWQQLISAYLFSGAALTLMLFTGLGLLPLLRAARRDAATYTSLTLGAAVMTAVALFAGGIGIAAVGASALFDDDPVDPGVARFLDGIGYGSLLIWGGLSAALLIAVVSAAVLRERILPVWFGWLGVLAAIVLLFAVIFVPMLALPVWALVAGVLMLMGTTGGAAATGTAQTEP